MTLGVTLARGGSKGLPGKNIRDLNGKPLIAWTIEAAKASRMINRYVVSTEDPEIAAVAKEYGAEIDVRPSYLAEDHVNRWEVLKYLSDRFGFERLVLLQPTSPVRPKGFIDDCIMEFINKGADHLATGYMFHDGPYSEIQGRNRQEINPFFVDDGNVYIWRRVMIENDIRYGGKVIEHENSRKASIDINDGFDFWIAGKVLEDASL